MEVSLHANECDVSTQRIAFALDRPFEAIGRDLSQDFGGKMKHLWIDFELIESHAKLRPPWSFRFQKRVGGSTPDQYTGLPRGVYRNVGHYSVRPNFRELRRVPLRLVVRYVLGLVYASTSVLIDKEKKLGGFDAQKFRSAFLVACRQNGYPIDPDDGKS
jgi:hypothetical protein